MTPAQNSTDDVIVVTEHGAADAPHDGAQEPPAASDRHLPGAQERLGETSDQTGDRPGDDERTSGTTPAGAGSGYPPASAAASGYGNGSYETGGYGTDADTDTDEAGRSRSGAFAMPGAPASRDESSPTGTATPGATPTWTGPDTAATDTAATGAPQTGTTPTGTTPTATGTGPDSMTQADANWPEIQATFVDDPRRAVERAAEVTSAALSALVTAAQQHEQALRQNWQAEGVGTEELRTSLQHYRELSTRLVSLSQGL